MDDFECLQLVNEEGVIFGKGCPMHTEQRLGQESDSVEPMLKIGGENEVHPLPSSVQKAVVPENESEDIIMTDQAPPGWHSRGEKSEDTGELEVPSARETRSARKRQNKTIESEKLAKADNFEDFLVDMSNPKDTEDRLALSEETLKKTEAQLKAKTKNLATCRQQLRDSKEVSRNLRKANNDLEEILEASREELSNCRDDLFSLQRVAQTPDSIISKRFESIDQQIVHWIEMEVATFEKAHPYAEPESVFSAGEHETARDFQRLCPGASEHLARHFIHRALGRFVFSSKVNLFGLPEETAQLLREAEVKFAELDPPRDSVAIASWRSETLNALVKTRRCADYCQQQSQKLNSSLFEDISVAFPALFSDPQARAKLYEHVLLPAINLANTIKMSTSDYVVLTPYPFVTEFKSVTMDELKLTKMLDLETGRHLKPDSAVVPDKDGVIGNYIMCLEPGLRRITKGKATTLSLGTILVKLFHPVGKRVKGSA